MTLNPQEPITITLTVMEWSKVGAALASMYGWEDETLKKVQQAVGLGN